MRIKRIRAPIIAGLLLLTLVLPQLALAAGPEISNVQAEDITATTAIITWTTNTSSDGEVYYGKTTPPMKHEPGSAGVFEHSITIGLDPDPLEPDTKYYYFVESTDTYGTTTDDNGSAYYYFTTLELIEDAISLSAYCGYCGDLIEVTATVGAAGNYRICWAPETTTTLTSTHSKVTFTASAAGSYTVAFSVPDTEKGIYTVHLTREDYTKLAEADFEVLLFVKIDSGRDPPDEGPVGTEVTISGSGFKANQNVRVNFLQGEVKKGDTKTGTANSAGIWTILYTIPETPGGDYTFVVEFQEGTVWYDLVGRGFEVTPEITAPSSGTVGHTIEVKGTGFQSNEKDIEITLDDEVVEPTSPIEVTEKGSWNAIILIPPLTRGHHTIDASGKETKARDVPDIDDFFVGAGILVEPPGSHYVGDIITVKGGGFASKETGIKVTFGEQVKDSGITAKEDGTWESSFELPASTYGPHDVSASGDITTTAVTASLSIKAKIEELNPKEGARGDTVSLTGSGFGGSKTLTVTVGGAAAEQKETKANGDVVISFHVPKCTLGKQTLKVTDGVATAEVDFTVTKKVLPTPLRISPEDSTLRSGKATFSWHGITGDSGVTYTYFVEISKDSGFISGLMSEPNTGTTELSYTLSKEKALDNGTYYWRVKAVDNYGNESEFSASDYSTFKVSVIQPWVWVVVGLVVLVGLMVVAYRETKFKVTE